MASIAGLAAALATAAAPAVAVVAGDPTPVAEAPWMVALPGCTGTLIAPDRILTAGHCTPRPGDRVRIGASDNGVSDRGGVARRITRVARHPDYSENDHYGGTASYDLAVAELDRPVRGTTPVALADPAAPAAAGTVARILGYGSVGLDLDPQATDRDGMPLITGIRGGARLRSAPLELVGPDRCRSELSRGASGAGREYLTESMLCAVDPDKREPYASSCLGDSGGPTVIGDGASAIQIGVTSWTLRCGQLAEPSVLARVDIWRQAMLSASGPVWAPRVTGRPVVRGRGRVGAIVRCDDSRVRILGRPYVRRYLFSSGGGWSRATRSRAASYRVRTADRGRRLRCRVEARNEGGSELTVSGLPLTIR